LGAPGPVIAIHPVPPQCRLQPAVMPDARHFAEGCRVTADVQTGLSRIDHTLPPRIIHD
jgi:hypothetical protein